MPVDIAFSYWFFFWVVKAPEVLTQALGWDSAPDAPCAYQQSASALVAVGLFVLWSGRRSLWRALRHTIRPSSDAGARGEPLRPARALELLAISVVSMALFVCLAGAPVWILLM